MTRNVIGISHAAIALAVLIFLHGLTSIGHGQISVRSDDVFSTPSKQFFYHWNGFEVEWHGSDIDLVKNGDLAGIPASGTSFSQGYTGNTFAYTMTAVSNWNTAQAVAAVASSTGLPPESSPFMTYLNSRTQALVDRHGGSEFGFGVDNGDVRVSPETREDKIDVPGEALVIKFDLQGQTNPATADGTFGPGDKTSFQNNGLNEHARLVLKELVVRPWALGVSGEIDYLFYDASEGTYLKNSTNVSAFGEYVEMRTTGSLLTGPWTIEHGDILIIAHPTNTANDLSLISSELWSMTFDLVFDTPARPPLVVPSNPADIPQHPYSPGFSNIWREDAELLALYRTEPGNDNMRTVVMDFHRGYLLTENRGSTIGNSRIFFNLSDVTSKIPSVPNPLNRTLTEVLKVPNEGNMHLAYSLVPDYRVNHPGDSYVNLSGLSNSTPSITTVGSPPGYPEADGGARSAYILPYHYVTSDSSGTVIKDARTGETLSQFDDYGFGDSIPVPIGNILLLSKVRAGERAIASYDVSDPANPVLLDVMRGEDPRWRHQIAGAYEPAVYNNYFVIPMSLQDGTIGFVDYSNPSNLRMHHIISGTNGEQRYIQFQDHRMFAGTEVIDITHLAGGITPTEHDFPGHKGEYMLPLGNLVVCAENSEQGSSNMAAIYAFQAEPDVRPPSVTYHVPAAGAIDQLVTSRVGLLIHETLDVTSINQNTFRVFPVSDTSETSIVGTRVWSDKDVLTFTPLSPLAANTTYRVVVEGFTDIVGNPIQRYSFDFTTAGPNSLWYPTINSVGYTNTGDLLVGFPTQFVFNATPDNGQSPSTLEYQWDFGDGTVTSWSNANQTISHTYKYNGKFTVNARVRSINKPELTALKQLHPSVFFKPAGEDGFEPLLEAETASVGSSFSIIESATSSGGFHLDGSSGFNVGWDFDAVGGTFDFNFRLGVGTNGRNNNTPRSVGVFLSDLVTQEDGSISVLNRRKVGVITSTFGGMEDKLLFLHLPYAGKYRIELNDTEGTNEPFVDYLQIKMGNPTIRYEAESQANITNGSVVTSTGASGGSYVAGNGGFNIQWNFASGQGGTHNVNFQVASASGTRSMGVYVNGELQHVITSSSTSFQSRVLQLQLIAGNNIIELRDSQGTQELNVDFLDITVPAWVRQVIPPSQRSSQIVLDVTNRLVISVNPDNDTITAIHADTLAVVWEKEVADNPRSLAIDALGRVWVTCFQAGVISVLDPANPANDIDLQMTYGSAPHDIIFNQDGTRAFVSLYGSGEVIQLDAEASTFDIVNRIQTGPTPAALVLRPGGDELLVTRFISPTNFGEVYSIQINTETDAMTLQPTIQLAKDTESEDGPSSGRGVPNYLSNIAIDPKGEAAYVASQEVNSLAGMFRDGTTLNHDSTIRSIVSRIDFANDLEDFGQRIDIDDSSQPSALMFSPRGDYLFVALQGNNKVHIIETATGFSQPALATGLAPQGLCYDPTTNRLFTKNFMGRSVSAFDVNGLFSGSGATKLADITTVAAEKLSPQVLQGKKVFYNASDERMSLEGYMSCASCHQDGGHDGVTWDFTQRGEGLRNTTDLRGRSGMAHGNVHWSGNFDEIQDFELDIINQFGGTGFIESGAPHPSLGSPNAGRSAQLDALAAYISSLATQSIPPSPHRSPSGGFTAEALKGKRIFEGQLAPAASGTPLSCTQCHAPNNSLTDSALGNVVNLHHVGTIKLGSGRRLSGSLTGIDTPSLWGLHDGAPYLHDGSAATLEDVFNQFIATANPGEDGAAHNLSSLNLSEKSALMAYLRQIESSETGPITSTVWTNSWGENIGEETHDYDGDSITNFNEYLMGGNPLVKDSGFQTPRLINNGGLFFEFNQRTNDPSLSYRIMSSTDLKTWTEAFLPAPAVQAMGDSIEKRTYSIPIAKPKEFFRVEINH